MNPKIDSKIIVQKGLKSTYNEPPRLIDARQLPKPSLVDFLQSISLCKEDKNLAKKRITLFHIALQKMRLPYYMHRPGSAKFLPRGQSLNTHTLQKK